MALGLLELAMILQGCKEISETVEAPKLYKIVDPTCLVDLDFDDVISRGSEQMVARDDVFSY